MIITIRLAFAFVVVCCLLLLVDIALRVRQSQRDSFTKQFAAIPLYTNGTSGILISDRIKEQPLWSVWNFKNGDSVNCFVKGKLVLGVSYVPEGRAETEVNFYGKDGKLISQWKARENGLFYVRTFFGEDSVKSEFWLNDQWHNVEVRTNGGQPQSGIVLDGRWRHVMMLTNGVLGVKN